MKNKSLYISIVALVVAVIALSLCVLCCSKQKTLNGGATDVEAVLMEDPEIIVRVMQSYEAKMIAEASAQAEKAIQSNIEDLQNNPNSPVMGNPEGKIVLVEFFDYSCGYCHSLYSSVKNLLDKNKDVKFVAKELAFVSEHSEYAAKAAFAAKEQGKYANMHDALMNYNGMLAPVIIDEIAQKVGLDMDQYREYVKSDKAQDMLRANNELAAKVQVNGVPTIVINGKMLQTIDEGVIQEAINAARK